MCSQASVPSCWTSHPREYLRGAKLPLLGELLREHEQQWAREEGRCSGCAGVRLPQRGHAASHPVPFVPTLVLPLQSLKLSLTLPNACLLFCFPWPVPFGCWRGHLISAVYASWEAGGSGCYLITQASGNNDKDFLRCAFREVCG